MMADVSSDQPAQKNQAERQPPDSSLPSARKRAIRALFDRLAPQRKKWVRRNAYYYEDEVRYMRFLVPEGSKVLELGCGTGRLLAALRPSFGVGVDFSQEMISIARCDYPDLTFHIGDVEEPAFLERLGGPFDVIILSDTIGYLDDIQATLSSLHTLCTRETRLIVAYFSQIWRPLLAGAERLGGKMPQSSVEQNWLSTEDITELFRLADFDLITREWRLLLPRYLLGIGALVNRSLATLPGVRRACLRNYLLARPGQDLALGPLSTTVVIPSRNERGNIEAAVQRIPRFCQDLEILFVEGGSSDGTLDEMQRVAAAYPQLDITVLVQDGIGKGDAVRKGFQHARGDVLMILDADLTMPPEALPKFYTALVTGKGNLIQGSRLVYPMEKQAMRYLNMLANYIFSLLFSWLLNQRTTDTLCGTKVLTKDHYRRIEANRLYFGEFDPFGDFDLLFGAAKANLKITEIPIRYAARTYGETQISRFRHGWLLLRMVVFAYRKLKGF